MIHHQNSRPAWIERSPSWTETVELSNGTDITVHQPVPVTSSSSAGGEGEFIVDVTVCGGIDSLGKTPAGETAEREVQNTVQSSDYALRGEGGAELTPVVAEERPPVLLEPKECTSFELRYRGEPGGPAGPGLHERRGRRGQLVLTGPSPAHRPSPPQTRSEAPS